MQGWTGANIYFHLAAVQEPHTLDPEHMCFSKCFGRNKILSLKLRWQGCRADDMGSALESEQRAYRALNEENTQEKQGLRESV